MIILWSQKTKNHCDLEKEINYCKRQLPYWHIAELETVYYKLKNLLLTFSWSPTPLDWSDLHIKIYIMMFHFLMLFTSHNTKVYSIQLNKLWMLTNIIYGKTCLWITELLIKKPNAFIFQLVVQLNLKFFFV